MRKSHVPKRLDLGEFGDLADYLHIALGKQLRLRTNHGALARRRHAGDANSRQKQSAWKPGCAYRQPPEQRFTTLPNGLNSLSADTFVERRSMAEMRFVGKN
jgi:hypothetical protein